MFRRRHEQRLGRRQTAANPCAGATGLDALAHPGSDRHPARNDQRLPESRRHRGARPRPAERIETKTGHFRGGVHRPRGKTGNYRTGGVHRPRRPPPPGRAPSASACEPYREIIAEALARGRNAVAIWQDLVDDHGFPARYASVRRFVVKLRGSDAGRGARGHHDRARRRRPGRLRRGADGARPRHGQVPPHAPLRPHAGLLAQIGAAAGVAIERADLGGAARARVSPTGRHRPRRSSSTTCKEGVLTPDIYDPALNPLYRDVLAHYGVVALPCRVGDPDRKGKVEAGVGHAQKTPLKGLRFERLEDAQAYLDRWETHWADTRIHGTTKRQVAAMFAEEQPALGPLPLEPFRYYQYGERTVHLDGCVEVEAAYYGAPPGWIGHRVHVQWDGLHVRLLRPKTGQLLREHLRAPRGWHRMHDDDRPARTPASTIALLTRAKTAAAHLSAVCEYIRQHECAFRPS